MWCNRLNVLYKILKERVAVTMNYLDLVLMCDRPVRGPIYYETDSRYLAVVALNNASD